MLTGFFRGHLHLEQAGNVHAFTDGRATKVLWRTEDGREQFFDLVDDPRKPPAGPLIRPGLTVPPGGVNAWWPSGPRPTE